MGWDDVWNAVSTGAEAVGSLVGAVGDAVGTAVDTVANTLQEGVDSAAETATGLLDDARDALASFSPVTRFLGNVILGTVKGAVKLVHDVCTAGINTLKHVGALADAILHLDPAGFVSTLLQVLCDILLLNLAILALVFLWWLVLILYAAGAIYNYFARDAALQFIHDRIIEHFQEDEGNRILARLGFGTSHFGLPIRAEVRIMMADSDSFPLAQLHQDHLLDLYQLAGLLSFDNAPTWFPPRTRIVQLDDNGNDMWYMPITRLHIRSFLRSNGSSMRLRVYAMRSDAAGKSMRTATNKFKKLCIDLSWDTSYHFAQFQAFPTQPCLDHSDFHSEDFPQGRPRPDFNFFGDTEREMRDGSEWFFNFTHRDGSPNEDGTPLCIALFQYRDDGFGLTLGRNIKRSDDPICGCHPDGDDPDGPCITDIARNTHDIEICGESSQEVDESDKPARCASGCTWRDAPFPDLFGNLVLGHELGHYFGLAHAGHYGIECLMLSTQEQKSWFDWGTLTVPVLGIGEFTDRDVEDAWRFIINKMPHVLEAL